MTPTLEKIDHVHVYVTDRAAAEAWYGEILGFRRVDEFMLWAVEGGPLTIANDSDSVHLALFEKPGHGGSTAIAFGCTGAEFLAWRAHLEAKGLELRISDHELAYSLYFHDPDNNLHEITTYEHAYVAKHLA